MPDDTVDGSGITVLDVLHQKHPSVQPLKASSLVPCVTLLLFEDVEITGSHLFVAHHIQGVLDLVTLTLVTGGMCGFVLVFTAPDFAMLLLPLQADY